jgi:DNA polymerase I-like protein with 3'-5' exonuclease and polymerase domains
MLDQANIGVSGSSLKGENWIVLNYEDAMYEMERTKQLYLSGEIFWMVFDLETSLDLLPWKGEIIMFSWAHMKDNMGYCVPLVVNNDIHHNMAEFNFSIPSVTFVITPEQRRNLINKAKELIALIPLVGHNLKYDVRWLIWHNWADVTKIKVLADTLTMGFQMMNKQKTDPKGSLTLKNLANRFCGVNDHWEFNVYAYLNKFRLLKDRHFGNLPTGLLGPYAAKDSIYNRFLYQKFDVLLPEFMRPITATVTYAMRPFADAEMKGLAIDQQMKEFLTGMYHQEQTAAMQSLMELPKVQQFIEDNMVPLREANDKKKKNKKTEVELREEAFSITSNKDLVELIYGEKYFGMPVMKFYTTEKGQPQVNKDYIDFQMSRLGQRDIEAHYRARKVAIEQIQIPFERVKELRALEEDYGRDWEFQRFLKNLAVYKRLEKLRTTYIEPLNEAECFQGSFKPEYEINFVKTGRLSSGFHTLPSDCDIKRLYISRWEREGGLFLAVDQSQLELRVIAALSGEVKMIEAFKNGVDAHTATASQIYKIPIEQVTSKQRKVGKIVNFAIAYGKTAKNLAVELGMTEPEAQEILNKFFGGHDKLTAWIAAQHKFVMEHKCIMTPWGRRIPIGEAESNDKWENYKALRVSVNYPVQSSASDIVLHACNGIWNQLRLARRMNSLLVGAVHDSIEVDVFPGELFSCVKILQEEGVDNITRTQPWLGCPLELSFELGKSWGGALECKIEEITDNKLVFTSTDIKKDFVVLQEVANRAYNCKVDVLEDSPLPDDYFETDIFVRDHRQWKARVTIERK